MAVANGDGEGIAAGFLDKLDGFFGLGVMAAGGMGTAFFAVIELGADQMTELGFDGSIIFMRVFNYFAGDFRIFFKRLMAGIDHDAGETFIDALLAEFEGIAMVQMDGDGDVRQADGGFDELLEIDGVRVLTRTLGYLKNQRSFFLFASLNDSLDELHVVDVEGAEGVLAF